MTTKAENVYGKLQAARVQLQGLELKESGKNTFAGYSYMELGDFLPKINSICAEIGLCGVVNFGENATLTIVNTDNIEERIVFSSPMSTAELKGCHAIQNLGAVQSYLRRYLWMAAFEIVEHDALDGTTGKERTEQKKPAPLKEVKKTSLSPDQEKYFPRIRAALDTLQGDNLAGKKEIVKFHTTFTGDDGQEVEGVEDYRKLDGKRIQVLAHKLEAIVAKQKKEGNSAISE